MSKFLAVLAVCAVSISSSSANELPGFQIDSKSARRTVCNVTFEKIPGLVVVARKIKKSTLTSRVDNERYEACPYKVLIQYAGRKADLGFIGTVTLDSVTHYSPVIPVHTGFFLYDGKTWHSILDDVSDNRHSSIKVQNFKDSMVVSGPTSGRDLGTGIQYFCYGFALINRRGVATTGECSERSEDITPWQQLFDGQTVVKSAK
jgi:hypothetical protein